MESVAFADVLIAMGLRATRMMSCRISGHVSQLNLRSPFETSESMGGDRV